MTTLILPVAGKSSRFPSMRPKWLLTMPSGRLMFEESVGNLDLEQFDRVIVTCLSEHLEKYVDFDALYKSAQKEIREDIEFCILDRPTQSPAETVFETLKRCNVNEAFYLKDCDNSFTVSTFSPNSIATISLNDIDLIDAKNKSYVQLNAFNEVTNIVEKNVISNEFCCGGYAFSSGKNFIDIYNSKMRSADMYGCEIYISHIIYAMLLNGVKFTTHVAKDYVDWGTLREYRHEQRKMLTLFCDVDGVLVENSSKFATPPWGCLGIQENLKVLSNLQQKGHLYLVITTSRPQSEQVKLNEFFAENNVFPDQYVMGLPHSKRVLVNDFSNTNQYPTSLSINLSRNSPELQNYLSHLIN